MISFVCQELQGNSLEKCLRTVNSSMAGKDQKLEKISKMQFAGRGVAYRKNEKPVWRYGFQQYVAKF